ncbi:SDR family oxidoreductase [Jatrophihabitans sp.]|uniref:SDR family NAD(P)-dependent oxidoreductase n=1 Tax=Jatrophihabitans sp. TaxID=1932789 RepID=UPI0030C69C30|nr:kduD [Jatrophihabitans sp.]
MSNNPFDLSGRVALVTGGNSGIGLGIARALAAAGADIAVWGTNAGKNEAAVDELSVGGSRAMSAVCDVGDPDQVAAAFAETVAALGKVDVAVANAGIGGSGTRFVDIPYEEWRRVLAVNLDGVFTTFQHAARDMIDRGSGGSLIAVSSIIGTQVATGAVQPYAASKAAIDGLVRSAAVELGRWQIRVNSIRPGWVHTPLAASQLDDPGFAERSMKRLAIRRWGTPADIGGAAVYLASDASKYHTGDDLAIDGGYPLG